MKLYHYVHCPFCLRVRMSLGFLNIPYESVVVPYNDEVTPVKLTGKKMLPIFEFSPQKIMNESLDIIAELDTANLLQLKALNQKPQIQLIDEQLLNRIGNDVHSLCMPYFIWTPEFNEVSRQYFQTKKEVKRGPFKNLIHDKEKYIASLNQTLHEIEKDLKPFYLSDRLTINDIMLASHLWGMYIFPEYQFPTAIHQYLMRVKALCHFDYHADFWK